MRPDAEPQSWQNPVGFTECNTIGTKSVAQ
jgi:hypothetical protein